MLIANKRNIRLASVFSRMGAFRPLELLQDGFCLLLAQTPWGRKLLLGVSVSQITNRIREEEALDDILDTVLEVRPGCWPYRIAAVQLRDEIERLAQLVQEKRPTTILEIGTSMGGTLYVWSRYIESARKIVSIDLPGGSGGGGYDEQMVEVFRLFAPEKRMDFIRGDSHSWDTWNRVSDILDGGVDFLFIDGDHTYEGVKRDFQMYSPLVNQGGVIALHDIVEHPDDRHRVLMRRESEIDGLEPRHLQWGKNYPQCNVDRLWSEVVSNHDNTEAIISHPLQTWGGIGIVRI